MYRLSLTNAERNAFDAALKSAQRKLRFTATLYRKDGTPLGKRLDIIDGEVIVDCSDPLNQPTRTAHITVSDPYERLSVDAVHPEDGGVWFSKRLGIEWGIWVESLQRYIDVPVFFGPFFRINRTGINVEIDASSEDAEHLDPHLFRRSISVRKHTKIDRAVRAILIERGVKDKEMNFMTTHRRLNRDRTWRIGQVPWKMAQRLVDLLDDAQLFVEGDGKYRLRRIPDDPVWRFLDGENGVTVDASESFSRESLWNLVVVRGEKTIKVQKETETETTAAAASGADRIVVKNNKNISGDSTIIIGTGANAQTRKVSSVNGNTILFTQNPLDKAVAKGTKVITKFKEDKRKRIIGKAQLADSHPLSAASLSPSGLRPAMKVKDRRGIKSRKKAEEKAESIIRQKKFGIEQEVSFSALTIPHLQELDPIRLDFRGVEKSFRMRKWTIPLTLDGTMEVNYSGSRAPKFKRSRQVKGSR